MHTYKFSFQAETHTREQRLCFDVLRSPDPSPAPINRAINNASDAVKLQIDAATRRQETEKKHLNEIEWINAFTHPDFLTAPKDSAPLSDIHGPEERMKHLTPDQRKEELKGFVQFAFPNSVRTSAEFKPYFDDIFAPNNLTVIQQALKLLVGEKGALTDADVSWKLAKKTMYERNPGSVAGNRLVGKYIQWVKDNEIKQSDYDAISPARIYEKTTNGELKGAALLGFLDEPGVMAGMKLRLRERDLEIHQEMERSKRKMDGITGKAERDKLAKESQTFMDNFRSLDPRMQLGLIAAGVMATLMLLKSKNWFAKAIPITLLGSWGYLTLFKGDTEAVDHIAEGIQRVTTFSFGKVRTGAEKVGILAPKKEEIDKLTVMGNFLESKARRSIDPGTAALSALANAKIGVIADAFTFEESAGALTGELQIDTDPRNPAGKKMHEHLKDVTKDYGSAGREKMFAHFKANKRAIGSAVLHVMYTIGSGLEQNAAASARIDTFVENGGDKASYESLSADQKAEYLHIAFEGMTEARRNPLYKNITLVDLITQFTATSPDRTNPRIDGAEKVNDTKAEKPEEFSMMDAVRRASYSKPELNALLADSRSIAKDSAAFLDRCETELQLEASAKALLIAQFDKIRKSDEPLPIILQTIEKFKYAILLSIYNDKPPTTAGDIEKMLGSSGSFKLSDVVNNLTNFINTNIITISSHFGTAVSIRSVKSLLVERTGTSSITSLNGRGLPKLQAKMDLYEIRLKELRDTKVQATKIIDGLPTTASGPIIAKLGGTNEKAIAFVKNYLDNLGYSNRIDRMEQYFAQKCTNSLVQAMLVTQKAGKDVMDKKTDRSITAIEEDNLAREFDTYFDDICKDTTTPNMWENGEQLSALTQPFGTAADISNANFKEEPIRLNAVNHVKELFTATILASRNNRTEATRLLSTNLDGKPAAVVDKLYNEWKPLLSASTPAKNNEADRLRSQQSYREAIMILIPLMETLGLNVDKLIEIRDWKNPDGLIGSIEQAGTNAYNLYQNLEYVKEGNKMNEILTTFKTKKDTANNVVIDLGSSLKPMPPGYKYTLQVTLYPKRTSGSPSAGAVLALPKTIVIALPIAPGTTILTNHAIISPAELAVHNAALQAAYPGLTYDSARVNIQMQSPLPAAIGQYTASAYADIGL